VGARLLVAAVLLEIARLVARSWLETPLALWLLFPLLLALALLMVRAAGLTWAQIGLRRWREWTTTERSYFVQVVILANIVFPVALAMPLQDRLAHQGLGWALTRSFLPYLLYGFYQEIVYRGMIQNELIRRYGAVAGIVMANTLYTFGPLHAYYFAAPVSLALPMFTAIFAIGLVFGVIYRRSGNLWIVGVMHAIGNAYMVTALTR
jgi:membrane protease YdiL (CAAX protease family)